MGKIVEFLDEKCVIKFWVVIGWETLEAFICKEFRNSIIGLIHLS